MTYTFRKAATTEAKPLIGLYSESGCGKTKSALLIAKGFTGDMAKVGMIETESGRGEAYADDAEVGGYNVLSLRESFSPKNYGEAISAAEHAGLQCLIVDSASHEWEGVGGVLAMAAANQEAGKKGPVVWQKPKMDHAREFMLRLTQTSIPLVIVCMRAKYPMEETVRDGKKDWTRSKFLAPKQSEDILFEMFVHGWIDQSHNFRGTKYTLEVLRKVFIDGEPVTVETGRRLAAWASGRKAASAIPPPADSAADAPPIRVEGPEFITPDQVANLDSMCQDAGIPAARLRGAAKVERLALILAADYQRAKDWIAKHTTQAA